MEDGWDLLAVVRGCSATSAAAAATTSSTSSNAFTTISTNSSCSTDFPPFQTGRKEDQFLYFPDLHEPRSDNDTEGLHDLFKPFCPKLQPTLLPPQAISISPFSVHGGLPDLFYKHPVQQQEEQNNLLVGSRTTTRTRHNSHNPRSKKRKNQIKRVCQVPVEGLSSDMWSWRKYGQKPIKGSPYPRGYYRCSTSKGCLARKQVERNRSDPNMFIVTYTGEHSHPIPTHRNSLAGSTRQKPTSSQTVSDGEASKPTCSSPISPAASQSPAIEKAEVEEEDLDFGVSEMALSDDFFMGLEEITGPIAGDGFGDHLPLPWLTNNAATITATLAGK